MHDTPIHPYVGIIRRAQRINEKGKEKEKKRKREKLQFYIGRNEELRSYSLIETGLLSITQRRYLKLRSRVVGCGWPQAEKVLDVIDAETRNALRSIFVQSSVDHLSLLLFHAPHYAPFASPVGRQTHVLGASSP